MYANSLVFRKFEGKEQNKNLLDDLVTHSKESRSFTEMDRQISNVDLKDKLSFGICGRFWVSIYSALGWKDNIASMVANLARLYLSSKKVLAKRSLFTRFSKPQTIHFPGEKEPVQIHSIESLVSHMDRFYKPGRQGGLNSTLTYNGRSMKIEENLTLKTAFEQVSANRSRAQRSFVRFGHLGNEIAQKALV